MSTVWNPDKSKPLLPQAVAVGLLPLNHRMPDGTMILDCLTREELTEIVPPHLLDAVLSIHKPRVVEGSVKA